MGGVLTDLVRWVIEVVHSLEYVWRIRPDIGG